MKSKKIVAYRLFRCKDNNPEVLFHGFDTNGKRTRRVTLDTWLCAEERHVWNPGKKSSNDGFLSGWHIVLSKEEIKDYFKRFKNTEDIRICKVYVRNVRPKPRSKIMLARWMFVATKDWEEAC